MKLRIIFIAVVFILSSCNESRTATGNQTVIDLSSFGSVNMIKEIGGDIYVLNSTASAIHKLSRDSLSIFRDLEIGGRDFLLDFDIEGDKVYYSNTYDEIFISSGSAIEDTISVFNPDRIAVIDSLLFVTSRKPEDENVLLKLYDIKSKKEISCIPLNDSPVTDIKFAQVAISEVQGGIWLANPFRSKLERYNDELKVVSSIDLPQDYEYGNFSLSEAGIIMLATKVNEVFLFFIKSDKPEIIRERSINSLSTDIRTSCIAKGKVLLYDFINSSIIINLTK